MATVNVIYSFDGAEEKKYKFQSKSNLVVEVSTNSLRVFEEKQLGVKNEIFGVPYHYVRSWGFE